MDKAKLQYLKDTFKQLISELLFPAACALIATVYQYSTSPHGFLTELGAKSAFEQLSAYFLKLFYWGAFFAYAIRAMKAVRDRKNHDTVMQKQQVVLDRLDSNQKNQEVVIQKQQAALDRLDSLAVDMVGYSTGGNGYCYIWNVSHNGSQITRVEIMTVGDFAMLDVSCGINSLASMAQRRVQLKATGNPHFLLGSDYSFSFPSLPKNVIWSVECNIPLQGSISRYFIRWQARNGSWVQRLEVNALVRVLRPVRSFVNREDGIAIQYPQDAVLDLDDWK